MKAPSPLPEKRPEWMSLSNWDLLREDYAQATRIHREATSREKEFEEAKRRAELAVKHYEDSLLTLAQHTIEDA